MDPINWSPAVSSTDGGPVVITFDRTTVTISDPTEARAILAGLEHWAAFTSNPRLFAMVHEEDAGPLLDWLIERMSDPLDLEDVYHYDLLVHARELYNEHTAEESPLVTRIVEWARAEGRRILKETT